MARSSSTSSPASRDFLRRLAPRLRPHRGALLAAAVLVVLATGVGLAFPLIVRSLLDAAFLDGSRDLLNRVSLGLLVLIAVQSVLTYGQSLLMGSISERVVEELRTTLFGHLVRQSPAFFNLRRVGELTSRLNADIALIQSVLRFGIPEMIRQGLFLIGALVLLTVTHPRLTLVTLTAIPLAAVVGWLFGRRVRRFSTRVQDRVAEAMGRAEEVFTQIRVVQGFTREGWEAESFGAAMAATREEGLRRARARAALTGAVTFAAFGAVTMVLWEGGRLVLAGALTPGTLVAFLLYATFIAGAVGSLSGFWGNLQEAAGAAERVFELLDHEPELASPRAPRAVPSSLRGEVGFEKVRFRYSDDGPEILRGIDLTVSPGEMVAIVGGSGAGKTTLVSLLPRFFDVTGGRVTLDGIDVREIPLERLRRMIGMVPQEPMLFAGTIRENILYADPEATPEQVAWAVREARAEEFISRFPGGLDERVGERGVTLSAGQRQRIAIARVFLRQSPVLVLDEASSSLDAESEAFVQEGLARLMKERATLVIAHRLSTILEADRIVVLEEGTLVESGTHEELLDYDRAYARLYRRQFQRGERILDGVASGER